jgi:5-(carboxyamino)imidazole ribonucleotide mutase
MKRACCPHTAPPIWPWSIPPPLRRAGLKAIIAGAGGAAHLAGVLAAKTTLPVLGVPVPSKYLKGQDSLYSIVQMPKGIPVATFAIGEAGAANAALFAVAMLALSDAAMAEKLHNFRKQQVEAVLAMKLPEG